MTPRDDATEAQVRAAAPDLSTWLSANAGSGKTRVLTSRVARLLLNGADPQRILCLTYTKAAAGEMQNRLFANLGAWSMKPDADLRQDLEELGETGEINLDHARTLFAQAIETPGGLKIQTIHSFCSSLLRRFPLEAGISPDFAEMDETAERQLVADITEDMAGGEGLDAIDAVARYRSGEDLVALALDVVRNGDAFRAGMDREQALAAMGLDPTINESRLVAEVLGFDGQTIIDALPDLLDAGKPTDQKNSAKLRSVKGPVTSATDLEVLEDVFLLKKDGSSKAGSLPTSELRKTLEPGFVARLDALMDRVETGRLKRLALAAAEKTLALHQFAGSFLPIYERVRRQRGWLSFDDLIGKTRELLSNPSVAAWVLYRLDGGIDHILVDEAQDTSPEQWRVIDLLSTEITAGKGARDIARTLFVVGDKKQSIYSFQGADAESFDRMADAFAERLGDETPLQRRDLTHSFRSSRAILDAVDAVFAQDEDIGAGVRHHAFHTGMPGRVDLWPVMVTDDKKDEVSWEDPVDTVSPAHATLELARGIADTVAAMIEERVPIADQKGKVREITPGDILILVQGRRGRPSLFDEIIKALKVKRLPVAGADRLKLKQSLAVRDLTALLAFLDLPEDSLSLAAALRSPIFGWSERDLYQLAHDRKSPILWEELRNRGTEFPETLEILKDLRESPDILRPYDLLERILIRHGGRKKLLDRLGPEAEDSIDAMLNLALAFERMSVPSLTGFLSWLEAEDTEIKRDLDASGGRIRVMTVHGSKGLESPVVILPDTTRRERQFRGDVLVDREGRALWNVRKDERPEEIARVQAEREAAESRERRRLLYVAMTRAESWLVVCGAGKMADGSWYDLISNGLAGRDHQEIDTPAGPGRRFVYGDWPESVPGRSAPQVELPVLPDWATTPVEDAPAPEKARSPSDLGGAKALPGDSALDDEERSKRRGRQIHLLLEHLPAVQIEARGEYARALLSSGEDVANAQEAEALFAEVSAVLAMPDAERLFSPDGLAEVEFSARLDDLGGSLVHGTMDRLIVSDTEVEVIDFKSNPVVPQRPEDTPEGILRQMGAYVAALGLIYPGRSIRASILWTAAPHLMALPHELVIGALRRAGSP